MGHSLNTLNRLLTTDSHASMPEQGSADWLKWRFGRLQAQVEAWLEEAIESAWQVQRQKIESLPEVQASMQRLWQATRHATLLGGKRIRPILSLVVWHALGKQDVESLKGICISTEMIHAQSLVFDDLPCMDDDDTRRGKPTTHRAFDEATAVLVGDALACFAFECLIAYTPETYPLILLELVQTLAGVGSFKGLVNGQYADMWSHESPASLAQLRYIHAQKTGALLEFAVLAPARLAGVPQEIQEALGLWVSDLGQLFQATDDLLDATASSDALGKTAGKDAMQEKLTYVSLLGIDGTQAEIHRLVQSANQHLVQLARLGLQVEILQELQDFIQHRGH